MGTITHTRGGLVLSRPMNLRPTKELSYFYCHLRRSFYSIIRETLLKNVSLVVGGKISLSTHISLFPIFIPLQENELPSS